MAMWTVFFAITLALAIAATSVAVLMGPAERKARS
jgi:hypothetical protein